MAIAASDLIALGALSRPEDDVSTSGGAIDVDNRPEFTEIASDDDLEVVSANAGDTTQLATVTARNTAGAVVTEGVTLNGTTAVIFSTIGVIERVLKFVLDADAAGIVTLRRSVAGATVSTVPIGERGFYRMFLLSASESGAVERYEKIFWKNAHATLTLNSAGVDLTADPSSRIKFGIETAKDDTVSVTNRKTVPSNPTFVDDNNEQSVPSGVLAAGETIGTWIEQGLLSSDAPFKSSFTTKLAGTSA